jgi:hypothetical protein
MQQFDVSILFSSSLLGLSRRCDFLSNDFLLLFFLADARSGQLKFVKYNNGQCADIEGNSLVINFILGQKKRLQHLERRIR